MAHIKGILKINDPDNANVEIESFEVSLKSNNVSKIPYTNNLIPFINSLDLSNLDYGATGTIIGLTNTIGDLRFGVVDNNNVRSENYKGMDIGYTNSSGILNFTIEVTGQDIISFKIVFDKKRGQYPTYYTWTDIQGNETIVSDNDSEELSFSQVAGYGTLTINFSQWELANTMVGIVFIENVEIDVNLDKSQIISFESQSQKVSDGSLLEFGAIANTGSIILKDVDNTLFRYAELGYLNINLFSLDLYVNDKLQQEHISNNSPYYTSNREMKLELTNEINRWTTIIIPSITYNSQTRLYDVLSDVLKIYDSDLTTLDINNMLTSIIAYKFNNIGLTDNVEVYLKRIRIPAFTLNEDTFYNQLKKICNVGMLNVFIDDSGKIKFVNGRPKAKFFEASKFEKNIIIPYKNQVNSLEYDILYMNRFDEIEIK